MADIVRAGMGDLETPGGADTLWARRDFFTIAGWAGLAAVVGAGTLAFTRFMFPRVLFEPNPVFAAGRPDEYVGGVVDERFKLSKRVWIVRQEDGSFYALLAICTHLGCTPNWLNAESMRVSVHREHPDRSIVNTQIGRT